MAELKTHFFYVDQELGRDWGGRSFCTTCGLPKRNPVHEVPDRPEEDASDRILGEHEREG